MTRRVPIPFIVGDKTVRRLKDLKEVLQNNPAELLPTIEDGRLKRFLRGYGPKFEQLFQQYSDPKELLQTLANLLNVELGEFKEIPQYIKTPKELLENLGKQEELPLGKGIFEVEQLILDKPTLLKGLGRNETLIKAKLIVIANPNVEFERLTVETETVVFLEPIKKLKRASFIAKGNATISNEQVITTENAELKVGKALQDLLEYLSELWIENSFNISFVKAFEMWIKDNFKEDNKVVENKIILVKEDIILENKQISIKNSFLLFEENTGLVLKNGTFIAENSKFLPRNGKWKNVTLIGNIEGHIKGCLFKDGRGRKAEFYNEIGGLDLWSKETMGGGLLIHSIKEKFLIEDSTFKNCHADLGGGIYVRGNNQIKNCEFNNCAADFGGGVYVSENNQIENCKFVNCSANSGGGVFAWKNNRVKNCKFNNCSVDGLGGGVYAYENTQIENCKFVNCAADFGGGVYVSENTQIENCKFVNCSANSGGGVFAWKNNRVENCKFNNCSVDGLGGGVYCRYSNTLRKNTYINCKPDNTNC